MSCAATLAIRVQHHPSRAALLPRLLSELDGLGELDVVTDPGGRSVDTWRVHRACLEQLPGHATHLLVIQDDAVPQPGFVERLELAVDAHPEQVLLGFVPGFGRERGFMRQAAERGSSHYPFTVTAFLPTVCIVYPRDVVTGLLAWVDEQRRRLAGADDGIVAMYARRRKLRPVALVPCLVEHDDTIEPIGKTRRPGLHRRAAML